VKGERHWIPAFAGMTVRGAGMTVRGAGMTVRGAGMTVRGAGMRVRGCWDDGEETTRWPPAFEESTKAT
jgi:hypothetical protein